MWTSFSTEEVVQGQSTLEKHGILGMALLVISAEEFPESMELNARDNSPTWLRTVRLKALPTPTAVGRQLYLLIPASGLNMQSHLTTDITAILNGAGGEDAVAAEELIRRAYDDLRRIAAGHMRREGAQHTLQPTALVHEVWLKLEGGDSLPSWPSRGHFFAWASRVMANFLCDHARHKKCQKSGGGRERISLDECDPKQGVDITMQIIEARDAIEELSKHDETRATILRLATFSDLSEAEIASSVELSTTEVKQSLKASRLWLLAHLEA